MGQLGKWTEVSDFFNLPERAADMGWHASAKGHISEILPVPRSEYLALRCSGLRIGRGPTLALPRGRLRIGKQEKRRLSLHTRYGKCLCVRAKLRVVFCYRQDADEGNALVRYLSDQVAHAMELQDRTALTGETYLVVGS